jgi:hypothetical protein
MEKDQQDEVRVKVEAWVEVEAEWVALSQLVREVIVSARVVDMNKYIL